MEDLNFCPVCGKNLPPDTSYCPACGNRLDDPVAEKREAEVEKKMGRERITIAAVLLLLYSIPMVILGIWLYVSSGNLAHEIFTNPDFASLIDMLVSEGETEASLASSIGLVGMLSIFAGSIGVAAAILAFMRKVWIIALILCMLSAIVGTVTLFGLIMGLIAFYMLYKAKPAFTS